MNLCFLKSLKGNKIKYVSETSWGKANLPPITLGWKINQFKIKVFFSFSCGRPSSINLPESSLFLQKLYPNLSEMAKQ